ncbi:protein-glutamate methylesterase/protein-glutamine glutaminase [Paenibacillus sp. FSL H7-0714]|uniref:protein-glutamate methylesterase/protein-glutamine glutaminase n=1 Tax=Paenibacillus sp. FSL H7-0714 TaxID=2954735 RepID=UPI0030F7BF58
MKPYKVLVVDDSAFMRKIISDLIENDADFQVTATATNGREAIEKINKLRPDLVTMDVEMPEMNGLEALKIIMASDPLPVIMLSGINEEGMKETILALEWGAFDFIRKPSISNSQDITGVGESLREQMKEAMLAREQREARASAFRMPDITPLEPLLPTAPRLLPDKSKAALKSSLKDEEMRKPRGKQPVDSTIPKKAIKPIISAKTPLIEKSKPKTKVENKPIPPKPVIESLVEVSTESLGLSPDRMVGSKNLHKLVAVGCSTGGPRALKVLLEKIPADFPAPIVIVQHMPPNFTKSLAQRLNTFSPLEVLEAEQGMILRKGAAYIAPGGYHLQVTPTSKGQYAVVLTKEEARNGHRPSVDVLFESLLPLTSLDRHVLLMTGMGSDGARMMKSLYDSGVTSTFAESEETCVVYGMPRSAVELQCVKYVLPLQEIAPRLVQAVK